MGKVAIIAGAGVAGLTAARELQKYTDIKPIIFEMTDALGGISKTVKYKGNHMDIGGHRFFSKSDRVMNWWMETLSKDDFLKRTRLSRIYYLKKFFDYPIQLNMKTLKQLGFKKVVRLGFSYTYAMMFPIKPEKSLEDFFINRFGKSLYETFFKDYTEKVWGVPCKEIKPEWGSQRIKGISIRKVIGHAIKSKLIKSKDLAQKDVETSLIGQFLYPKFGVGQMWEKAGQDVIECGGQIHFHKKVVGLTVDDYSVKKVEIEDMNTGDRVWLDCDYFLSTMPVKELVGYLDTPTHVSNIAKKLMYRDFISVGVLCRKFDLGNDQHLESYDIKDNWIYVQENSVKMGRIQIFNNWSPYMVENEAYKWIGLEYFCNENDDFWSMSDDEIKEFSVKELIKMKGLANDDVIDALVVRMPKAYPSYFGGYENFDEIRRHLDEYNNMYLMGRNGMHRYNNMDHSMLTAMAVVENIKNDRMDKSNIWDVNSEEDYHEEKDEQ